MEWEWTHPGLSHTLTPSSSSQLGHCQEGSAVRAVLVLPPSLCHALLTRESIRHHGVESPSVHVPTPPNTAHMSPSLNSLLLEIRTI